MVDTPKQNCSRVLFHFHTVVDTPERWFCFCFPVRCGPKRVFLVGLAATRVFLVGVGPKMVSLVGFVSTRVLLVDVGPISVFLVGLDPIRVALAGVAPVA